MGGGVDKRKRGEEGYKEERWWCACDPGPCLEGRTHLLRLPGPGRLAQCLTVLLVPKGGQGQQGGAAGRVGQSSWGDTLTPPAFPPPTTHPCTRAPQAPPAAGAAGAAAVLATSSGGTSSTNGGRLLILNMRGASVCTPRCWEGGTTSQAHSQPSLTSPARPPWPRRPPRRRARPAAPAAIASCDAAWRRACACATYAGPEGRRERGRRGGTEVHGDRARGV